jgi:hypothetical protein
MNDREDPGWSRSEWARWWLDHDEVDEAARALEPGDVLAVGKADFLDLAAALTRRGLTAQYEDGSAFVYTPAQVQQLRTELGDAAAAPVPSPSGDRKPPVRSPAPASARPDVKKTA